MADEKLITLTHLNIRQSIAILLAKLILIDFLLAAVVVGFYFALVSNNQFLGLDLLNPQMFVIVFGAIGIFKVLTTCYIVLLWLNEYYEITTEYVIHKRGIIFKKQEHYRLDHIRKIEVVDSIIGELFNFATITILDVRLNKYLDMYLIHNARRYAIILKQLLPELEMKEDHTWLPFDKKEEISDIKETESDEI